MNDPRVLLLFQPNQSQTTANAVNSFSDGVSAQSINSGQIVTKVVMAGGSMASRNFIAGGNGWYFDAMGNLEANNGHFRGDISGATGTFSGALQAGSGTIGGFVITPQKLYGGIIETSDTVGSVGTNGVIMDTDGLRGYSATIGQVFNIPTNGDQPTFSNGVILVSNMYSTNISGGTVVGAIITGGTIKTAADGRRVEITSDGIQAINGALGVTLGDSSKKLGDNTRFFGSGVLVYINNNTYKIPFYVNQEQTVADIHLYNRSAAPTGKAEVGDLAVINNKLNICTSAGTPGTFTVCGTQT
jgi:hypothetical protein